MNLISWSSHYVILVSTCHLVVRIVVVRPSLHFHELIWISAVHANMDKSGAQDRRILLLNLTGAACKGNYNCKHNPVATHVPLQVAYANRQSYIDRRTPSDVVINIQLENTLSLTLQCIIFYCKGHSR